MDESERLQQIKNNTLSVLQTTLFAYLGDECGNTLKDIAEYTNILATSKSNWIKDLLLQHWKKQTHLNLEFHRCISPQFLYYVQFFTSIQYITINQYQMMETQNDTERNPDIVNFLDTLYEIAPNICHQLELIRLFQLKYDSYDQDYCHVGSVNLDKYIFNFDDAQNISNNASTSMLNKKYRNLKCFISCKHKYNAGIVIYPELIEYISNESQDLNIIDIDNMAPDTQENTAFKTLFNQHQHLKVLRIRNCQYFECSPIPSIKTSDFHGACLDDLEVLMIENNNAFRWNEQFVQLLSEKLNVNTFLYVYLTQDGEAVSSFIKIRGNVWSGFEQKFRNCFVQNRDHHWSNIQRLKSKIIASRNE